jgi:hypothetical protein
MLSLGDMNPFQQEAPMAKGQMRSNKEKKKPKAPKAPAASATPAKGKFSAANLPGTKKPY